MLLKSDDSIDHLQFNDENLDEEITIEGGYHLQYIVLLGIVVSSIIKNNSRLITFLFGSYLWLLFGFNTSNADYGTYELIYSGFLPNHEPGFILICRIANFFNLSYQEFLILISFFSLAVIIYVIRKYTKSTNAVLVLYLIFPFFLDVVQIRNTIAMSIVLLSFKYLMKNDSFSGLKYMLMILLASSFHYSSVFYLVFVLTKFIRARVLFLLVIVVTLTFMVIAYTDAFSVLVKLVFESPKVTGWFEGRTRFGFIAPIFLQSLGFLLLVYLYKLMSSQVNKLNNLKKTDLFDSSFSKLDVFSEEERLNQSRFNEVLLKVNIMAIMIFIFYIFNVSFFRLFRNLSILNYCLMINSIKYAVEDKKQRIILIALVTLYLMILLFYFVINDYFGHVIGPIFKHNLIF